MSVKPVLLAASAALIGANPAQAQTQSTSDSSDVMQLTALDYIEIEQLNHKYAWAIDTCADDGFEYADLYTPDGIFINGENGESWQGRERLAEAAGGNGRGCPFPKMPLSHLIVNLVIQAAPGGATGKSYLVYPGKNGEFADEKHQGHDGGYQDVYVKTADGWRFRQRIHVFPPQYPGEYTVPNTELDAAGAPKAAVLGPADRAEIQALMGRYAQALGECRAEDFADLFVPGSGYFASGFRGRMVGREQLIELVESERHCTAAAATGEPPRRANSAAPTVEIELTPDGVHGVANLGTAEYQDEYLKTPQGWRFASRTVLLAAEKAAGLDARGLLDIQKLGGDELGDNYVADESGIPRLLNSGIAVTVTDGAITGRAYLRNGGYRDEVYEQDAAGHWRVKSSTYVPPDKP